MAIRILIAAILYAAPLFGQTPENVLLVLNETSSESIEIGTYYAGKRGIPPSNILRIKTSTDACISREDFERQIDSPIASWLTRGFAQDRILYIVLTKGMPVCITSETQKEGAKPSVDSELTTLYRKMVAGRAEPSAEVVINPYFIAEALLSKTRQFSHAEQDIYLVSRLDGPNVAEIRALIDRGFASSREGTILQDGKEFLEKKTDADPQKIGNQIPVGATGAVLYLSGPYTEKTILRPDTVLPAYFSGFNLIESYYLAIPCLSCQIVVIGDPLSAAYRTKSLSSQEIDRNIDPETEFPPHFGYRRLRSRSVDAFQKNQVHPETMKLIMRSEARMLRKDKAGAIQALEEAVARDSRLVAPQLQLASLYEEAHEYDKAIGCYRRLVELSPRNPVILNNLSYALAVRKKNVLEAIPLAEQAYNLVKESPRLKDALGHSIADTLGWIYHLAGQNDKAIPYLVEATQAKSAKAEMFLHLAVVKAETSNIPDAKAALQRALELDPAMEQSEEVKELRTKLK